VPATALRHGIASVYVVGLDACDTPQRLIDSGRLLVLSGDASQEVISLFQRLAGQIERFFRPAHNSSPDEQQQLAARRKPTTSCGCVPPVEQQEEGEHQQQEGEHQQEARGVLQRALSSLQASKRRRRRSRRDSSTAANLEAPVAATAGAASTVDGSSTGGSSSRDTSRRGGASSSGMPSGTPVPDAAMLYAYEHFFLRFLRQWAAVNQTAGIQELALQTACATDTLALLEASSPAAQAMQLLSFLLDNDMWACCVLLLEKYPALADRVQRSGLPSAPTDFIDPAVLAYLRGSSSSASGDPRPAAAAAAMQRQQLDMWQQHAGMPAWQPGVLQEQLGTAGAAPPALVLPPIGATDQGAHSRSPSGGSDDSYEDGSELLRRLGVLQHARGEQEALQAEAEAWQPQQPVAGCQADAAVPAAGWRGVAPAAARAQQPQQMAQVRAGLLCGPLAPARADSDAAGFGTGLYQRRGSSGKQRKLSWEEEQVDDPRSNLARPRTPPAAPPPAPLAVATQHPMLALPQAAAVLGPNNNWHMGYESGSSMMQQMQAAMERMEAALAYQAAAPGGPSHYHGGYSAAAPAAGVAALQPAAHAIGLPPAGAAGLPQCAGLPLHSAAPTADAGYSSCSLLEEMDRAINEGTHPPTNRMPHPAAATAAPAASAGAMHDSAFALWQGEATAAAAEHAAEPQVASSSALALPAADAAAHQALPTPTGSDPTSTTSSSSDAACDPTSTTSSSPGKCSSDASAVSPGPLQPEGAVTRLARTLRVAARGFADPYLEASYVVFKNHGCAGLDALNGAMCLVMLCVATLRSLERAGGDGDGRAWSSLITLVLYGAAFFTPYITMQLRPAVFLRLREPLLVLSRNLGVLLLVAMAAGWLPQVKIWTAVVINTAALQVQNGFILPACQQVRLPAAAAIAALHVPADAYYLSLGRPWREALAHSCAMQLAALAVTLGMDVWCRRRFLQRYHGVAAAAGAAAAPAHA
jgi:hypothetical protein